MKKKDGNRKMTSFETAIPRHGRDLVKKSKNSSFIIQLLFVLLISSKACYSIEQSPQSTFDQANKFYIEKNYEKSISLLETLVKAGNATAEVHFNLGNAYYKSGNYSSAILNYERAKKLKPSDQDIDFNLRLANLNTIDKIEPAPQVFYIKWWNDFVNSSSIESHTKNGLILIWIAFFISLAYLFVNISAIKRITFFITVIILVFGFFSLFMSRKQLKELNDNRSAIIISSSTYIKGSPDENSVNLFMLHSGTKVVVIDELKGWRRIRIANGNEGWTPSGSIEII